MKNNKKGGATVYLVIIALLILGIAALFIKLNWRRFKAEASFAFTIVAIVLVLLLIIFLMIRHSIRKARKEKEKAKEKARRLTWLIQWRILGAEKKVKGHSCRWRFSLAKIQPLALEFLLSENARAAELQQKIVAAPALRRAAPGRASPERRSGGEVPQNRWATPNSFTDGEAAPGSRAEPWQVDFASAKSNLLHFAIEGCSCEVLRSCIIELTAVNSVVQGCCFWEALSG